MRSLMEAAAAVMEVEGVEVVWYGAWGGVYEGGEGVTVGYSALLLRDAEVHEYDTNASVFRLFPASAPAASHAAARTAQPKRETARRAAHLAKPQPAVDPPAFVFARERITPASQRSGAKQSAQGDGRVFRACF